MIEIVNRATGEILDADSVPGLARIAALHHQQLERLQELESTVQDFLADHLAGNTSHSGTRTGAAGSGGAGGAADGVQRPVVWHRLTASEAHRTWQILAGWVGWLRGRYPLANQVPLCWWRHPELVEELTAVWLAWHDAYLDNDAPLTLAADWHARVLPDFLRRIGAGGWNIACEVDHRPRVTSLYDPRSVDDPHAFERHLTAVDQANPREAQSGLSPKQPPARPPDAPIAPSAPSGAATRKDITMDETRLDDNTMLTAFGCGDARGLGQLSGSPVAYRGRYWRHDGDRWTPVEDPDTIAFLEHAERRLALAEGTVESAAKDEQS